MPSISEISGGARERVIEVNGVPVTLKIDPSKVTMRYLEDLSAKTETLKEGEQHRFACEQLCQLIEGWDVTDDNGKPIPLKPDRLLNLPATVVWGIFNAAQEEDTVGVPAGEGGSSDGPS